jgi:hypothetical protein
MASITKWAIFFILLKFIILMTNEALKLVWSKQNSGPIIQMYTINIHMEFIIMYLFNIT